MLKKLITFNSAVMGGGRHPIQLTRRRGYGSGRRTLTVVIHLKVIRIRCIVFQLAPTDPSGSWDDSSRIRNADTHAEIGGSLPGHSPAGIYVSESADGCHTISQDHNGNKITWNRASRAIAWNSPNKHVLKEQNRERFRGDCNPQLYPSGSPFTV